VSAGQAVTVAASEPGARKHVVLHEGRRDATHVGGRAASALWRAPDTELGTEAAAGAGIGDAVGGGLGALLADSPGLAPSPCRVSGSSPWAYAAVLTGGAIGAAGGGLLGALIGYGIPEDQARRYETGIREGNIVMGVTPRSGGDAEPAAARLPVRRDAHSDRISK
jgi:hypothetical protein